MIRDLFYSSHPYKGYPTEKPVPLCKTLVEQSSSLGELVIDPFAGAASVGVAALETGRLFAGNDVSAAALAIASERLQACRPAHERTK